MDLIKYFISLFVLITPLYSLETTKQFSDKLTQIRINYYQDPSKIPSINTLKQIYEEITLYTNIQDRNLLISYWGIISTELLLYYHSNYDKKLVNQLNSIYKEYFNSIKSSKSSSILQRYGEFSLILIKLNPKKKLKYFLNARLLFLLSYRKDNKNNLAQLGLGKWWAHKVLRKKNMEFNHSISQANKYLDPKNILIYSNDPWYKINLFNLYYTKYTLYLKSLNITKAYENLKLAKTLFPKNPLIKLIEQY